MRISDWSSDVCSSDLYDVSSPWTYLAFTNIQPLAKEAGATIHWKPFLVGGVFNTVNPTMYRMRENPVPARDAWIMKDRKSVVYGKSVSVRVDHGGRRIIKKTIYILLSTHCQVLTTRVLSPI